MASRINTEVLIVGDGPVGLTLAIDLGQRGIEVTVDETRPAGEPPSVKCNHVASRTMEIFRRLGLVRAVREAGLPDKYPNDVAFRTTATGMDHSRIPIPCRAERYTAKGGANRHIRAYIAEHRPLLRRRSRPHTPTARASCD
jgi:2-polyprenyl-6-methoxyphenol hydroxylase-like FAD-dependent oxidoreductase